MIEDLISFIFKLLAFSYRYEKEESNISSFKTSIPFCCYSGYVLYDL